MSCGKWGEKDEREGRREREQIHRKRTDRFGVVMHWSRWRDEGKPRNPRVRLEERRPHRGASCVRPRAVRAVSTSASTSKDGERYRREGAMNAW